MILAESQRERRGGGHRTRHLSTMDSFLTIPRLTSKSTLKKNDSSFDSSSEVEKEELGKRRLHDMLPPSFVLKSAPSFLNSGGSSGGGKWSGQRKRSLLTKQKSVARMRRLVGYEFLAYFGRCCFSF